MSARQRGHQQVSSLVDDSARIRLRPERTACSIEFNNFIEIFAAPLRLNGA
jgi:hypothetical protein